MSYTILIVDDSAIVRTMVRRAIGMAGLPEAQVHEAANGSEALEALAKNRVDIVFADLNMPEMGGAELVERMSRDPALASTPVVIVSSEQSRGTIEELERKGIRAYITKPFRPERFRAVVEDILGAAGKGKGGQP